MVLAELQELAGGLGITGTARMRKSDLVAAIKEKQSGAGESSVTSDAPTRTRRAARRPAGSPSADAEATDSAAPAVEVNGFAPDASVESGNGASRTGSTRPTSGRGRRSVVEDAPTLDSVADTDRPAAAQTTTQPDNATRQVDRDGQSEGRTSQDQPRRDNNHRQRNDNRSEGNRNDIRSEGSRNDNRSDGNRNDNRSEGSRNDNRARDDEFDSNGRR